MQKKLSEAKQLSALDGLINRLNQKLNTLSCFENRFQTILIRLEKLVSDIKEIKTDIDFIKRQVIPEEKM